MIVDLTKNNVLHGNLIYNLKAHLDILMHGAFVVSDAADEHFDYEAVTNLVNQHSGFVDPMTELSKRIVIREIDYYSKSKKERFAEYDALEAMHGDFRLVGLRKYEPKDFDFWKIIILQSLSSTDGAGFMQKIFRTKQTLMESDNVRKEEFLKKNYNNPAWVKPVRELDAFLRVFNNPVIYCSVDYEKNNNFDWFSLSFLKDEKYLGMVYLVHDPVENY